MNSCWGSTGWRIQFVRSCAIYVDVREWGVEMEDEARTLQEKLNILTKPKRIHGRAKEYPDVPVPDAKMKNPRNKPCPCGSGKKYEYCCLNKQR
jgi:preprotein translocase subunit SecA